MTVRHSSLRPQMELCEVGLSLVGPKLNALQRPAPLRVRWAIISPGASLWK